MISLAIYNLVQGTCSLFHFTEEETEGPREAHGLPEFRCFRSQDVWVFCLHTPRLLPSGSSSAEGPGTRPASGGGGQPGGSGKWLFMRWLWCWLRGLERKTGEQGSLSLSFALCFARFAFPPHSPSIAAGVQTSEDTPC